MKKEKENVKKYATHTTRYDNIESKKKKKKKDEDKRKKFQSVDLLVNDRSTVVEMFPSSRRVVDLR